MRGIIYALINGVFIVSARRESKAFEKARKNPGKAQEMLLLKLIRQNADTAFGKKHGFKKIGSAAEYQAAVPLSDYEDYQYEIDLIAKGHQGVLTRAPVDLFELSSGSTKASKMIPYTQPLKREFLRGIHPWLYDLYIHRPGLFRGSSYWSITPLVDNREKTEGGVPIGFEEDSQYFGWIGAKLLDLLFSVPEEVKRIRDMDSFRYVSLLFLLRAEHLMLISVWNPSFLTLLLAPLENWICALAEDLETGSIHAPEGLDTSLRALLERKLGRHRKRAHEIRKVYGMHKGKGSLYEALWPNLKVISCWMDAGAGIYLPELSRLFPHVEFQGKGLLATEGFVSLPMTGRKGCLLSLRSHFLEFLECDPHGGVLDPIQPRLVHELQKDRIYSVVLTTGGGFYRYRLYDLIKVVDFHEECPEIVFMGKEGKVSDYCGEKLNEYHVSCVVRESLEKFDLSPSFYLLAPESDQDRIFYCLFLEMGEKTQQQSGDLLASIEAGLRENFHYDYCRRLGQLLPLRLFLIEKKGLEAYYGRCGELGQRTGNIKPSALHNKTGWTRYFKGDFMR